MFAEVSTAPRLATMAASALSGSSSTTMGSPMKAEFGKLDSRANTVLS